ncbi:MAG: methionyl-tRNA formyltransferase, partial [Planctomycetes bacterium]|nr:methionyl-tRNA formyltransferase [Planctomycetota bacterium]
MKIAFLGTGDFAVPALLAPRPDRHRVLCAISQPDRPAGRGRTIQPTPVHLAADAHQIEHFQTTDINTDAVVLERLAEADLAIVAAFGQKLAADTLRRPRLGCVNIHASLLPKYRGAAPYQWAVINGDETTGVTIFQIDEQWDAGPIWGVRSTPIGETETADELSDRLAAIGAELLVDFLSKLEAREATPMPQSASAATRAPKLKKSDGTVDWSRDARSVVRRINGLWSWPAANVRFIAAGGKAELVQL